MEITKVWVDFVLASGEEYMVRYERRVRARRLADGTVQPARIVRCNNPIYARRVSSRSVQLYDIDSGSIRKTVGFVTKHELLDFTHAVYQRDMVASTAASV